MYAVREPLPAWDGPVIIDEGGLWRLGFEAGDDATNGAHGRLPAHVVG